jgi:hypothetical protein
VRQENVRVKAFLLTSAGVLGYALFTNRRIAELLLLFFFFYKNYPTYQTRCSTEQHKATKYDV